MHKPIRQDEHPDTKLFEAYRSSKKTIDYPEVLLGEEQGRKKNVRLDIISRKRHSGDEVSVGGNSFFVNLWALSTWQGCVGVKMKLKYLAGAAVGAVMLAGQAMAATFSITGGGASVALPSDFNPRPSNPPGLSVGTLIDVFNGATIVGNGLQLSTNSNVVYSFQGAEAGNVNRAFEIGGVLFDNKTTAVGTAVKASATGGLLNFTYSTKDATATTNAITNGVGQVGVRPLTMSFFQIDPNTVYALFGDGQGDSDYDDMIVKIAAVPVPAGAALLLTAMGGLGFAARRKQKNA